MGREEQEPLIAVDVAQGGVAGNSFAERKHSRLNKTLQQFTLLAKFATLPRRDPDSAHADEEIPGLECEAVRAYGPEREQE